MLNILDLSKRLDVLAELLPTNCYSTVCKLKKITIFSDVHDEFHDKLAECDNASVVNKQLLSYLYEKCCNDMHRLYDVLVDLVAADKQKQLSKIKAGK